MKPTILFLCLILVSFQPLLSEDDLILQKIKEISAEKRVSSWDIDSLFELISNNPDKKYSEELKKLIQKVENNKPSQIQEYWLLFIAQRVLDKNFNLNAVLQKANEIHPLHRTKLYNALIGTLIIEQLEMIKNQSVAFIIYPAETALISESNKNRFNESELNAIQYYISLTQSTDKPTNLAESGDDISFLGNQFKFHSLLKDVIQINGNENDLRAKLKSYTWGAWCGYGSGEFETAKRAAEALLDIRGQNQQKGIFELLKSNPFNQLSRHSEERILQLCLDIIQTQKVDLAKALTGFHLLNPDSCSLNYTQGLKSEVANKILLNIASLSKKNKEDFYRIKLNIWETISSIFESEKYKKNDGSKSEAGGKKNYSLGSSGHQKDLIIKLTHPEKEQWLDLAETMATQEIEKEILELIIKPFISNNAKTKEILEKMLQSDNFHARFFASKKLTYMNVKINDQEFSPLKIKLAINSSPLLGQKVSYTISGNPSKSNAIETTDSQGVLEISREELHTYSGKTEFLELAYTRIIDKNLDEENPLQKTSSSFPNCSFFYFKIDNPANIFETIDTNGLAYPLNINIDSSAIPNFNSTTMQIELDFLGQDSASLIHMRVLKDTVPYLKNFQFPELCKGKYNLVIKIPGALVYEQTIEIINGESINIKLQKGYAITYEMSLSDKGDNRYKNPSLAVLSTKQILWRNFNDKKKLFDHLSPGEYLFSFTEDTDEYFSELNYYEGYQKIITINADSPSVIDLGTIELKQKFPK